MGRQDYQQVCINGHQINDSIRSYPESNRKFCQKCGAETLTRCPNCQAFIIGREYVDGFIDTFETPVPSHCDNCGKPFPWTEKKSVVAEAIVEEDTSDPLIYVEKICSSVLTI